MGETRLSDTMLGKMGITALHNWKGLSTEDAEKKINDEFQTPEVLTNEMIGNSAKSSVDGIAAIVGLSEEEIAQLATDIDTKSEVSPDIANKIIVAFEQKGVNESIVKVLSLIHDNWVKTNGDKFGDPARTIKKTGELKLYQFAPLELLDYGEIASDLIFLKPILEGSGIEINEVELEQYFLKTQEIYKEINGIKTKEDLEAKLALGAEFYPALEGVTTTRGGTSEPELITDIFIKEAEMRKIMTNQLADKANIKERTTVSIEEVGDVAATVNASKLLDAAKSTSTELEPPKEEKSNEQGEPEQ